MSDLNEAAIGYYCAAVVNGRAPLQVVGGPFDGLQYFEVDVGEGEVFFATVHGAIDPSML